MMHKPFVYWQHRLTRRGPIKLIMTILVKDEADIIEHNVRFHAAHGVDAFLVMDNGSTDGTREILSELQDEFDLHIIDQPSDNYQQAKWMTELALYARRNLGADMVISNDADEYWLPDQGSTLKDHLTPNDSVVTVKRRNMVLGVSALSSDYDYRSATHAVINPVYFDKQTQISNNSISMLLTKISPKTIVNPHGLIRLKGGNHWARHGWRWINARNEAAITVYHYPIRSFEHFEANIRNRKRLLEQNKARMGDHYRRWVRILEEGNLKSEFERLTLSAIDLKTTDRIGITQPVPFVTQSMLNIR